MSLRGPGVIPPQGCSQTRASSLGCHPAWQQCTVPWEPWLLGLLEQVALDFLTTPRLQSNLTVFNWAGGLDELGLTESHC